MRHRVPGTAVLWFLVLLALFELGAWALSPYRGHPRAELVNRNPTPLRAWPEYLRGGSSGESDLVALVGTSQGLGLEYADDELIFPTRLRRSLVESHPGAVLENWSVAGLRTDQLELLSLQAVRRNASVVVFVVSLGSIDEQWELRLGLDAADVDLLAGDPALWPMLTDTAVFRESRYHDVLSRTLLLESNLGRSRTALLDIVAEYLPAEYHRPLFGARRPRDARLTVRENLARTEELRIRSPSSRETSRSPGYFEDQYRRRRLPVFDSLYAGLRDRFRRAGIEMVWVWTPLSASGFQDTLLAGAEPIHRDICARIRADGWHCVDATRALPADHFLVGDIASHLNEEGHAALARLLEPVLADAVH